MAYIESHQELGNHPKTRKAARLLHVPRPSVIGHLHLLWYWAMDYAQDGDLTRYDTEEIAEAAMWDGEPSELIDALTRCGAEGQSGFLERTADGRLLLHDWWRYGPRATPGELSAARREWESLRSVLAPHVFAHDGSRCVYCGAADDLTVDHVLPLARGGTNERYNLQTACRSCNSSKHDKAPHEWQR